MTIITFGIQTGNYAEMIELSSDPENEHSFLLDSFVQFESLARRALHTGEVKVRRTYRAEAKHAQNENISKVIPFNFG